ncbi:MAG: RHS repeat-associated core domain-containing protein [Verrucomicrobiia bacterium]|jgi:RHS repeat-associated protein
MLATLVGVALLAVLSAEASIPRNDAASLPVTHHVSLATLNAQRSTPTAHHDPEVEFLELGVSVNGQKHWKMYGPDLDGVYGGLQGIGGLEAVINQTNGVVTPVVNDAFGNAVASVTNSTVVVWNPTRVGGYGPLPGSSAQWLSTNTTLAAATVWRGKRMDPTGYYWQGARYYDPVGGRFLSPDPLGHEASMDLYSYANGDPINGCDPDGRFGKNSSSSRLDDSWSQGMIRGYNQEMQAASDARASLFEQSFGPSPREAFIQQMERELNLQAYWDATTPTVHDPFGNFAAGVIRTTVDATGFGAVGTFMHDAYTGQQWLTGAPVSEGQAAFNMLASIGTMPLMMGAAMRPAASVVTRGVSRASTGLVGRSFVPQMERVTAKSAVPSLRQGQHMIDTAIQEFLPNLKFGARPVYNPTLKTFGRARWFSDGSVTSSIGPKSIVKGYPEIVDTILHEEIHLRWPHLDHEQLQKIIDRYSKMRGW